MDTSVLGGASSDGGARFVAYLREKLPLVEKALADAAATPMLAGSEAHAGALADDLNRYLYAPLAHFSEGGGKRVRPILALLGAEAVGGSAGQALSAGVAIELFQSAALVHDDIADKSELRRGEPCLHVSQGTGVAINMGDLALAQVFEVVLADASLEPKRRLRVLDELVRMERHTLEGQALDLGWVRDGRWDLTESDYLYMVASKTAWYSAACPLYIGALAAGGAEEAARGLLDVGMHTGIAFQLQDDLLNLVGDADAQGKDFRSDITEGKRTLAAVWALEHLDEARRTRLVQILEAKTGEEALLAEAVGLIEEGGGISRCREMATQEAQIGKTRVNELVTEGSIAREAGAALVSMADFFVERKS